MRMPAGKAVGKKGAARDEAAEAEAMAKKLGVPMGADSDAALFSMIRAKQQRDNASLIEQLEAKYAAPKASSKATKRKK